MQESLFRVCYEQEGYPPHTSRTLLSHPCASPTQPLTISLFSDFVHPGTWNTLLHCSSGECLLSPFLIGDLLQLLNWKKQTNKQTTGVAHKNMEFTIHKQYCLNNYYVFFLLDHIIALTSEAFPLACRELLIKMMKTQLGKCGKIRILSCGLASLQPWLWIDLNQSPLAYQFCSSQISTLSLLPPIVFKPNLYPVCLGMLSLTFRESLIFCFSNTGK